MEMELSLEQPKWYQVRNKGQEGDPNLIKRSLKTKRVKALTIGEREPHRALGKWQSPGAHRMISEILDNLTIMPRELDEDQNKSV